MSSFAELGSMRTRQIWPGVVARMVQSELITMAVVELAPDSVVPEHHHVNEQLGFVIEGTVVFTVGGERRECGPGSTWRILADVPHDVCVGPDGAVVAEVYSPVRADWAALSEAEPQALQWPHTVASEQGER
ncbi:cupin domain-containing protein [Pseudonocardia humida]|uniref:Cupin domain-containing protein n=1 Tax=Pseudonocardia humida TaxID=2800819 RepID=A0ABT1A9Y9_9PSEU|nr:cupin domain-containing protein [Pseudonocardia humida]MCO1659771.1 cupin domain-containing protein [Pseudonocardia humida]